MKKSLLLGLVLMASSGVFAQNTQNDNCYKKLEEAFQKRGAYTVADEMHRNVIISFFEGENVNCVSGKVRVENGVVVSVFIQYGDESYELFQDKEIFNAKKQAVSISNGISDLVITPKGERYRVVFIDKLKPKPKALKQAVLPDDL